ncbi:hypothetical protein PG994_014423 [Apiospora phragmitis]|uniref:P450 monooxygenase n=1 Tax=Apiospora phragmitis TaxID=2905665 RepID=A0ABR1T4A2_9PEZI
MALLTITGVSLVILASLFIYTHVLEPLLFSSQAKIPGPKAYALTKWRLALEDGRGTRTRTVDQLHQRYGPVVRTGPNEVSFNNLAGLRTIYGPGSPYGRTDFYRMFDVYGRQNLFTFHSVTAHGRRKRLVSHAYSKTAVVRGPVAAMVEAKAAAYMQLLATAGPEGGGVSDVFETLHWYSWTPSRRSCMAGTGRRRPCKGDVVDPARWRLSWFAVHWPGLTKWLYTRTGWMESAVRPLLPMQKPATYTGIRKFALEAYRRSESEAKQGVVHDDQPQSILERLLDVQSSEKNQEKLDGLDIASECADHLLAGIDTTSDTLMFLIWALSRPQNRRYQDRLRDEVRGIPEASLSSTSSMIPTVEASDRCTYLGAVIKETLRLYSPLPASEPRSVAADSAIDGFAIPAGTTVGASPFSLHRNPDVFRNPLVWDPDRWLDEENPEKLAEMNRWFWAFSSGGRMCIGLHLAMAEMTTLAAAIYRKYQTSLAPGFEDVAPGITSRFEVFSDDIFSKVAVGALHPAP